MGRSRSVIISIRCSLRKFIVVLLFLHGALLSKGEDGSAITQGTVIAHIVGPNIPTTDSVIPAAPNHVTNLWVTLKVVGVRDNFAKDLKGKTIRLPTCEFSKSLLGQTIPLRLTHRRARIPSSDYWLLCTSLELSRIFAGPAKDK